MPDLGIDVLFKGTNFIRLLGGLWTALEISLISVGLSIPLGHFTWHCNDYTKQSNKSYNKNLS